MSYLLFPDTQISTACLLWVHIQKKSWEWSCSRDQKLVYIRKHALLGGVLPCLFATLGQLIDVYTVDILLISLVRLTFCTQMDGMLMVLLLLLSQFSRLSSEVIAWLWSVKGYQEFYLIIHDWDLGQATTLPEPYFFVFVLFSFL